MMWFSENKCRVYLLFMLNIRENIIMITVYEDKTFIHKINTTLLFGEKNCSFRIG